MSPVFVLDSLLRSAFNLYFGMKNGELSVTSKKKNQKKPRKLSITSKHVIITCLHKSNKPRYFFYTVYTIGSADLRKVLDRLIDLDLTGFISGR